MTFLELCQAVISEGGISNDDALTTVTGQSDMLGRVVNWVSRAWVEIQEKHIDWGFLRVEDVASVNTTAGTYIYTPADMGIVDGYNEVRFTVGGASAPSAGDTLTQSISGVVTATIKNVVLDFGAWADSNAVGRLIISGADGNFQSGAGTITGGLTVTIAEQQKPITFNAWVWDSFRVYDTTAGRGGETMLTPQTYGYMRDVLLFGGMLNTRTRPSDVSEIPSNHSIVLGPIPAGGYTVTADYYKQPVVLTNDTDVPDIPAQHHMIIAYRALWKYGLYEAASEVTQYAKYEYEPKMYALNREWRPMVRFGRGLA